MMEKEDLKSKTIIRASKKTMVYRNEALPKKIQKKVLKLSGKPSNNAPTVFTDSFVIEAPNGAKEKIEITLPSSGTVNGFLIVGKNSNVQVFEKIISTGKLNYSLSILVEENAELHFAELENASKDAHIFLSKQLMLEKKAHGWNGTGWLGGKKVNATQSVELIGNNAEWNDFQIVYLSNEQQMNLKQLNLHAGKETKALTVIKEVLNQQSKLKWDGMIKILPPASETESFLQANGLLLHHDAAGVNIPGLEIENNNVQATHSASIHHLSGDELFYLQSRGLSKKEAKKMLIVGFLESALQKITLEKAVDEIFKEIELKYLNDSV